jgi:hypothetical protein
MPYESNTYISPKGQELQERIFDNLFPSVSGGEMNVASVQDVVGHFRGDNGQTLHQTTQLMKRFIQGYEHFGFNESYGSGIHICPHCRRRDFMWLWEYVDFGIRNDNEEWTSSIELKQRTYNLGATMERRGYRFNCRVRCNDATTCNDCHDSVTGHFTTCPSCSSSNVSKVGCGKESYIQHIVTETLPEEWVNSGRGRANRATIAQARGGQVVPTYGLKPFMFRVRYAGPSPRGQIISDPTTAYSHIPQLEIGYETYDGDMRRPYGYKCPNDDCDFERYAPPHGATYQCPQTVVAGYNQMKMQSTKNQEDSTGPLGTINGGRVEEQGGLVDNMGYCPKPACRGAKLVPRISIKQKLPSICFKSDGNPKAPRDLATSRGYRSRGRSGITSTADDEGINLVTEYYNQQVARYRNATPVSYPFSPMLRAFTRTRQEICLRCFSNYGDEGVYFWNHVEGITLECQYCGGWKASDREPHPHRLLNPPMPLTIVNPQPLDGQDYGGSLQIGMAAEGGQIWNVRLDCKMNSEYALMQEVLMYWNLMPIPFAPVGPPITGMGIQLCPNDVEGHAYGEEAQKRLKEKGKELESSEEDKEILPTKLVNLNGISPDGTDMASYLRDLQTAGEVPQKITINSYVEIVNPDRDAEFQTITTGDLLKYRPMDEVTSLYGRPWSMQVRTENVLLPPGEDSTLGITSPGFTFVVCEGRSREAYKDRRTNKWVDVSPPCVSFHNRLAPDVPLDAPFYYPRWTQTPENDLRPPRSSLDPEGTIIDNDGLYYWNHADHFAQDQYVVNDFLHQFMGGTSGVPALERKYHHFEECAEPLLNPSEGEYYRIFECNTCKDKYDIGMQLQIAGKYKPGDASIAYWDKKGYVNKEGETLDEARFPQKCMDAAIEQEGDEISNFGIEDPLMMNKLGRGGQKADGEPRTAKEMLETPRLVVEKDE